MPFSYKDQKLGIENKGEFHPLHEIVKDKERPLYIYDLDGILLRLKVFNEAFTCNMKTHYAVKANNHPEILKHMAKAGAGADVVSAGEIQEALDAGFSADKIIFSGVGKSTKEIEYALNKKIKQINIESPQELERVGEVAKKLNLSAPVAFRMNPDVNPETHPYIKTGFRENKFGMDESFLPSLKEILSSYPENLKLQGLTLHIGSQIRDIQPMVDAINKTMQVYRSLQEEGFSLGVFDIGGGVGINYHEGDLQADEEMIKKYGQAVDECFQGFDGEVLTEPGRILMARFGILVGQVQYIKETPYKNFAILNTGMHHLMRPCLYQAYHRILALEEKEGASKVYDVVGPICESSDVLGVERSFVHLKQGDWLAIMDAGAYGEVMASNYNSHNACGSLVF